MKLVSIEERPDVAFPGLIPIRHAHRWPSTFAVLDLSACPMLRDGVEVGTVSGRFPGLVVHEPNGENHAFVLRNGSPYQLTRGKWIKVHIASLAAVRRAYKTAGVTYGQSERKWGGK